MEKAEKVEAENIDPELEYEIQKSRDEQNPEDKKNENKNDSEHS